MKMPVPALALFALLAGCEARISKEKYADEPGNSAAAAGSSAADKSEEGQFSMKAPGFAMKFDIPKGLADKANMDSDSEIIYPGSTLSGMHIEGRKSGGGVELRFASSDAPATVLGWYRDPARKDGFTISSDKQAGGVATIAGIEVDDQDPFTLRLSARPGGGTDGRLTLADRR